MRPIASAVFVMLVSQACSPRQLSYVEQADGSASGGASGSGGGGVSGGGGIGQDDASGIDVDVPDATTLPWLPPCGAVSDDFDDNSIDGTKWNTYGGNTWAEKNGHVEFDLPTSPVSTGYGSIGTFGITANCQVAIELVGAPDTSVPAMAFLRVVESGSGNVDGGTGSGEFGIYISRDSSFVRSDTDQVTFSYVLAHRWLRIRDIGGTLAAEASPDGKKWMALPVISRPSSGVFNVEFGLDTVEKAVGAPAVAVFDNLGLEPK